MEQQTVFEKMDHSNQFSLLARQSTEEREFVLSSILSWWNQNDPDQTEYEYADNVRLAVSGDEESLALYEDTQRGGCCGSFDTEFAPSPSGRTWYYGFNYGH